MSESSLQPTMQGWLRLYKASEAAGQRVLQYLREHGTTGDPDGLDEIVAEWRQVEATLLAWSREHRETILIDIRRMPDPAKAQALLEDGLAYLERGAA